MEDHLLTTLPKTNTSTSYPVLKRRWYVLFVASLVAFE